MKQMGCLGAYLLGGSLFLSSWQPLVWAASDELPPGAEFPPPQKLEFPAPQKIELPTAQGLEGGKQKMETESSKLATSVAVLELKESTMEIRIDLSADVLFDFDKATLTDKSREALQQAAELIRQKAKGVVRIEGHTDGKGEATYNLKLSRRRAQAVKEWFITQGGLKTQSFEVEGYGKQRPAVSNTKPDGSDDPEGRQKNRRVQIIIRKGA